MTDVRPATGDGNETSASPKESHGPFSTPLPMPPVSGDATAKAIYEEIKRRVHSHRGLTDSICYNGGTIAALMLTGAATVLAAAKQAGPLVALCSAAAAFVIAVQRSLDFGGRWRWHLNRQTVYLGFAYRLNRVAMQHDESRKKRDEAYVAMLRDLERQAALEAFVPGSGEPSLGRQNGDPAGPQRASEPHPTNAMDDN